MKRIVLAGRGRRILSRFIDLIILLVVSSIIYLSAVFPFVFDVDTMRANNVKITDLYSECELFLVDDEGNYIVKTGLSGVDTVDDLFYKKTTFNDEEVEVEIVKSLYIYSTEQREKYTSGLNYDLNTFKEEILKVGSEESNIASYDETNYTFTLIDEEEETTTYLYFISIFDNMAQDAISSGEIQSLTTANQNIVLETILYILPVLFGVSLIFDLIIPLCAPNGQTIGKFITKLIVLDKNGYILKKYWLIPRFLVYILVEIILGVISFGASFLISYTMFMFNKKRRSIHDYCANSVVADKEDSIFFPTPQDEEYYMKRLKEKQLLETKVSEKENKKEEEINE